MKTHKQILKELAEEALDIQSACNLSGVAHAFSRAMNELCKVVSGTDARNKHPISVLYASKIASLTDCEHILAFGDAYNWARDIAEGKKPHNEVAIYEAQKREDELAKAEGRKPKCIKTMEDI